MFECAPGKQVGVLEIQAVQNQKSDFMKYGFKIFAKMCQQKSEDGFKIQIINKKYTVEHFYGIIVNRNEFVKQINK